MNPIDSPKKVGGEMHRRLGPSVFVYVVAHFLHMTGNQVGRRRLVPTVADLHLVGPKNSGQPIEPLDGDTVEVEDIGDPQSERLPDRAIDVSSHLVYLA